MRDGVTSRVAKRRICAGRGTWNIFQGDTGATYQPSVALILQDRFVPRVTIKPWRPQYNSIKSVRALFYRTGADTSISMAGRKDLYEDGRYVCDSLCCPVPQVIPVINGDLPVRVQRATFVNQELCPNASF